MAKKNKTSPIGTAIWPKVCEPDTKFNSDGVYETKLRLNPEDSVKFKAELERVRDEAAEYEEKKQGKSLKRYPVPAKDVETEDGERTGEIDFKFSLKALAGKPGKQWEQRPRLFDTKGKPIDPTSISIGSGSKIQVGFEFHTWNTASLGCGITLRLKAVMVKELVEYGGETFDAYDFENDGEGYVAATDDSNSVDGEPSETTTSADEDSDF